jgi:hypothetical protein
LKELLPFEVVADGEVVFVAYDVNRVKEAPEANHDVNKGVLYNNSSDWR